MRKHAEPIANRWVFQVTILGMTGFKVIPRRKRKNVNKTDSPDKAMDACQGAGENGEKQ